MRFKNRKIRANVAEEMEKYFDEDVFQKILEKQREFPDVYGTEYIDIDEDAAKVLYTQNRKFLETGDLFDRDEDIEITSRLRRDEVNKINATLKNSKILSGPSLNKGSRNTILNRKLYEKSLWKTHSAVPFGKNKHGIYYEFWFDGDCEERFADRNTLLNFLEKKANYYEDLIRDYPDASGVVIAYEDGKELAEWDAFSGDLLNVYLDEDNKDSYRIDFNFRANKPYTYFSIERK